MGNVLPLSEIPEGTLIELEKANENAECIAGDIMKGIKKPYQCPQFGKNCTPQNPLGAPMVSSEGACAAYYNFSTMIEEIKLT